MYRDKSGMFKDFNFKLVVINSLLERKCSFSEQLNQIMNEDEETEEINQKLLNFFQNLKLEESDLESIETLIFDAGEDIYFLIYPEWDGEDAFFDVDSIDGIEKLKNLQKIEYISILADDLIKDIKKLGICIE